MGLVLILYHKINKKSIPARVLTVWVVYTETYMKFLFFTALVVTGFLLLLLIGYTGQLGKTIRVDVGGVLEQQKSASGAPIGTAPKPSTSTAGMPSSSTSTHLPPPPGFIGPTGKPFVVGPSGPPPE